MPPPSSTWSLTRVRHLTVLSEDDVPKTLHLTKNAKTGVSIDFPVHRTCQPTPACMGVKGIPNAPCYALAGRMSYSTSVAWQGRNQRLVDSLVGGDPREAHRVADALWSDIPRGLDWIRWNGAGDLSEGAVLVINAFTQRHPDIALWVVSRIPRYVQKLKDRPSLRLMMSLDHTTPETIAARIRAAVARFRKATARIAYTRTAQKDRPPPDAWVVFNRHAGSRKESWKHPNVCHATLRGANHEGSCAECRYCFEENT